MTVTSTELRERVYELLDRVIESGEPLEIRRKGRILRVTADPPPSRLGRLRRRSTIVGDPGALVGVDWSGEWRP